MSILGHTGIRFGGWESSGQVIRCDVGCCSRLPSSRYHWCCHGNWWTDVVARGNGIGMRMSYAVVPLSDCLGCRMASRHIHRSSGTLEIVSDGSTRKSGSIHCLLDRITLKEASCVMTASSSLLPPRRRRTSSSSWFRSNHSSTHV